MSILIIDDDEDCLVALTDMLRSDYRVCAVKDAETGMFLARFRPFDLVILDDNLPGMRGLDMLREIRVKWPLLPVIMISGFVDSDAELGAVNAGANAFFVKPVDVDVLMDTVRGCLKPRMSGWRMSGNESLRG